MIRNIAIIIVLACMVSFADNLKNELNIVREILDECGLVAVNVSQITEVDEEHVISLDLSGRKLKKVPAKVLKLKHLQILDLSDNKLEKLPHNFHKLSGLAYVYLQNNKIKHLPRRLRGLDNLIYLDLTNNQIDKLPFDISAMESLVWLKLRWNPLCENLRAGNCVYLEYSQLSNL